jgi:predicted enzyme related to lactoylglutathione lyase
VIGRVPYQVVHLELHTGDLAGAREFYSGLCGWRQEQVQINSSSSYQTLELSDGLGGGIVECPVRRPIWLPYVEVPRVDCATDQARECGAAVLLEPREGPAGWRSVVSTEAGGELAFWQPKR